MRKFVLLLLFVVMVLTSCNAKESSNIIEQNINVEALAADVADVSVLNPSVKIEPSDEFSDNSISPVIDKGLEPADEPYSVAKSTLISYTLPETVSNPVVTIKSNGISEMVSNLYVSDNKIVTKQLKGAKIGTDTTKLQSLINSYSYNTSILAIRISDGSYIAYNIDDSYSCASTIKAPYALYCYKLIAEGNGSLNDTMTYQNSDYFGGSGVIRYNGVGKAYSIKNLLYYSLVESDNVAYTMLHRKFGNNISTLLSSAGCKTSMASTDWPTVTARDAAIWWNEIYQFRKTCDEGQKLFETCLAVRGSVIKEAIGEVYPFAHKSGWVNNVCHEAGVLMSNDPYIIVVLTNTAYGNENFTPYIVKVVREVDKLMRNY